MTRTGTI
jgi:3-methyladenine DNA glycosylase/8-oxoguanine DNA glycosylase